MVKTTTYKPEYCQLLIDHMSEGYSFESFGAKISHGRQTIYDWVEAHEDFKKAKELAMDKALEYFEKRLMLGVDGKQLIGNKEFGITQKTNINPRLLEFALKTRFHKIYGDKSKLELETGEKGAVFNIVKHENAK
jgi:hypothetical protein